MRLLETPEMIELKKIYKPYESKNIHESLIEGAPDEAIKAYEEHSRLVNEKYKQVCEMFDLPVIDYEHLK